MVVEHADPVWQGSAERVKAGLVLARRHLAQFLPWEFDAFRMARR